MEILVKYKADKNQSNQSYQFNAPVIHIVGTKKISTKGIVAQGFEDAMGLSTCRCPGTCNPPAIRSMIFFDIFNPQFFDMEPKVAYYCKQCTCEVMELELLMENCEISSNESIAEIDLKRDEDYYWNLKR